VYDTTRRHEIVCLVDVDAPEQLADGRKVAGGYFGGHECQVQVIGHKRAVRGAVQILLLTAVLGFVEGQALKIVDVVPKPGT
jgi:hypothetical protein